MPRGIATRVPRRTTWNHIRRRARLLARASFLAGTARYECRYGYVASGVTTTQDEVSKEMNGGGWAGGGRGADEQPDGYGEPGAEFDPLATCMSEKTTFPQRC